MRVSALALAILGVGATACTDGPATSSPFTPTQARLASAPIGDFYVTGFAIGPNNEDGTPPTCNETYELTADSTTFEGLTVYMFKKRCSIGSNTGGDAYLGGTISITGYSETAGTLGFGSTEARWDRITTISNFPSDAMVRLTAFPDENGTCRNPTFKDWVIDSNWSSPRYGNPLEISAVEIQGHRVTGEFQCAGRSTGGGGGGGGQLPPGYYYCDDPSSDPYCVQGDD